MMVLGLVIGSFMLAFGLVAGLMLLVVKGVLALVALPLRLVGGLIALPFVILKIVILGVVFTAVFGALLVAGVFAAIGLTLAILVPLAPLALIGLLVWAIARSARPAVR